MKLINLCLVCRTRCEKGWVSGICPDDLASTYLQGWVPAILSAYHGAYQDNVRYGMVHGIAWPCWGSGEVSGY